MKKIINPCTCNVRGRNENAFVKIEYVDGCLSLSGVIGPRKSGNCRGSAGQCVDEIRSGSPVTGWTRDMLRKLCNVWDQWNLNDMHPECEHQRELGWCEMAREEITLYHYILTHEAFEAKRKAEKAARDALVSGETFTPTEEQTMFVNLPYGLDVYEPLDGKDVARFYRPERPCYLGDSGFMETKTRGWVRAEDSEQGLLCKPCPVCGYKYGTAWKRVDVPQDVLDWLFQLPDTQRQPAWV